MELFIQLNDGQPVGHPIIRDNLHQLFPDETFSEVVTAAEISHLPIRLYKHITMPEITELQRIVSSNMKIGDDDVCFIDYQISELDDNEQLILTNQKNVEVRNQRNAKLMQCDWTQLSDSPITKQDKSKWKEYRQRLRDVTQQPSFPWNIEWPTPPNSVNQ
jgi:hypothetical protein